MFIVIPFIKSIRLPIVAEAKMRWNVFVSEKLSQNGNFHWVLILATEGFLNFYKFIIHSDPFLGW